jgi:sporulation protein YlmC with PRC-barrel domain
MNKWYLIGVLAIALITVGANAWAVDYYVIKKPSGKCLISKDKPKGDAKTVKGPFSSREEAQEALQDLKHKDDKTKGKKSEGIGAKSLKKLGAVRSSKVVGLKVKNEKGEDLGTIDELVITGNGKVVYVILAHGGFLGIGDNLIPIPWDTVKYDPEKEIAIVGIDKEILEKSPVFASKEWPDLSESGWRDKLQSYYKKVGNAVKGKDERDRATKHKTRQ